MLQRSRPRLLTAAAWSGLGPAPEGRSRGAYPHLSRSLYTRCQFIVNSFPCASAAHPRSSQRLPRPRSSALAISIDTAAVSRKIYARIVARIELSGSSKRVMKNCRLHTSLIIPTARATQYCHTRRLPYRAPAKSFGGSAKPAIWPGLQGGSRTCRLCAGRQHTRRIVINIGSRGRRKAGCLVVCREHRCFERPSCLLSTRGPPPWHTICVRCVERSCDFVPSGVVMVTSRNGLGLAAWRTRRQAFRASCSLTSCAVDRFVLRTCRHCGQNLMGCDLARQNAERRLPGC